MAMGLEVVELGIDFRQTAGIGGNEFVDFSLAQPAAVASHGGGFCAKMLGGWALNALGLEGLPADSFGYARFSESAITAGLPHFTDFLDFLRAKLLVVEMADFRL